MPAKLIGRSAVLSISSITVVTLLSSAPSFAAGFTEEQANAGQTEYQSGCANCHGVNLEGTEAPGIFGQDVMGNWITAGGLYDFISVAMPPTEPGELGEEAYLNIVAYVMKKNGAEAGDIPLSLENMASVNLVEETKVGAAALEASMANAESDKVDTNVPQAFTWGMDLPIYQAPSEDPAGEAAPGEQPVTTPTDKKEAN